MLCGLWTAENPTGLKPTGVFCDFWLRFSPPDGASWNIFHECQHFCNLGEDYQQMMLRTWMTGEVPVPGSVLGHSSCTSYANKNFAVLVKPEWPPRASPPTPHSPSWDSVHSVHYLPAKSAKSENNQAGWKHYANSKTVSDQRDETRPPVAHHTLHRYLCNIYWVKKRFLCDASDWHVNYGFSPLQSARGNLSRPRCFCMMQWVNLGEGKFG